MARTVGLFLHSSTFYLEDDIYRRASIARAVWTFFCSAGPGSLDGGHCQLLGERTYRRRGKT